MDKETGKRFYKHLRDNKPMIVTTGMYTDNYEFHMWVNRHGYVILDNSRENYLDWGETATRILVDNGIRLEGTYRDVWDYMQKM